MGNAFQFRGINAVVKAFDNYKDADAWAIYQAKNLLFKGSDSADLESILKEMEPFGSDAVYQLRAYEGIEDPKKIKSGTECDGSFSFKLGEESFSGGGSYVKSLEERIKKMENADEDEDNTIGGKIGNALLGLLEQPNELAQLLGTIKGLFTPAQPQPNYGVAAIGKVQTDFYPPVYPQPVFVPPYQEVNSGIIDMSNKNKNVAPAPEETEEQKSLRLVSAINTLEKADPNILQHLETLAKISADNPQLFKMMLYQLDNI